MSTPQTPFSSFSSGVSLAVSGRHRFRTNECVHLDAAIQTNRCCGTAGKPTFSRNGYKNGYSDEKEGQPFRAGLLVNPLLSEWCGRGDLNPAIRVDALDCKLARRRVLTHKLAIAISALLEKR